MSNHVILRNRLCGNCADKGLSLVDSETGLCLHYSLARKGRDLLGDLGNNHGSRLLKYRLCLANRDCLALGARGMLCNRVVACNGLTLLRHSDPLARCSGRYHLCSALCGRNLGDN